MKTSPAYQWYPSDFLSSSRVQRMTLEEECCYRRLLDFQWMDGYVPREISEMARLCKNLSTKRMQAVWDRIKDCFELCEQGYQNQRLELVRDAQLKFRAERSESGKKGAASKWGHGSAIDSAIKEPLAKGMAVDGSPSPSPSPSPSQEPITVTNSSIKPSPAAEKRAGTPDAAFDLFAAKFREATGTAYQEKRADFVQLAALRKANQIAAKACPDAWDQAIDNYLGSPLSTWTLADLCSKFATYKNSPTDRFKIPVNHNGAKHESREERTVRKNKELLAKMLSDTDGDSIGYRLK